MSRKWKERLREPSSWAGVGVILTGIAAVIDQALVQPVTQIVAGLAGLAAVFLGEHKR